MNKIPNLGQSPSWEIMLLLLSWSMISDTIPAMFALATLCAMNAFLINNPKYYFKWFIIYAFMSYFAYFSHVWTWSFEHKINVDLPFYDCAIGVIIASEVLIFIELLEKLKGKRLFILSPLKDFIKKKAKSIFEDRMNNYVAKKP